MSIDFQPGLDRVLAISASLDQDLLAQCMGFETAKGFDQRPWLIAGCSDGIGLQMAIAAIDAGLMKFGLGVYWEPAHLVELNEAGAPVSPVHYARLQNALGLEAYAKQKGVDFTILEANVILTPPRTLKGEVKAGDTMAPLPEALVSAFDALRGRSPQQDAVFVNSVAFGKWICPREGEDAITTPSVDFEGRLVWMSTKKYHVRGYQETLDTMGRNHLALMEALVDQKWLGPGSMTAFFTWAGGSQNVHSLGGIYGRGALGDAKLIAERDTVAFRLNHPVEAYGAHAVVRLPAFLSAALMGIPGGGLFGLVSQRVLEDHNVFDDMPALASKMVRLMFGPEWVRENPLSQIELDHPECLYVDQINQAMAQVHQRIDAFHQAQNLGKEEPIPAQDSQELLQGLVPTGYRQLLGRFRPLIQGSAIETTATAGAIVGGVAPYVERGTLFVGFEELEFLQSNLPEDTRVTIRLSYSRDGHDVLTAVFDEAGREVARGRVDLVDQAPHGQVVAVPSEIGEPVQTFPASLNWVSNASELMQPARRLQLTYGNPVSEDAELLAYRNGDVLTLVDIQATPVLQIRATEAA